MIVIRFFSLGPENEHDPVLQEIIVLRGIRIETLAFEIMDPGKDISCREYQIE